MPETQRPNSFPGTDDATGWPLAPKYPCAKSMTAAPVICHLALSGTPSECIYAPPTCPFYGRFPRVDGAVAEQGSWEF